MATRSKRARRNGPLTHAGESIAERNAFLLRHHGDVLLTEDDQTLPGPCVQAASDAERNREAADTKRALKRLKRLGIKLLVLLLCFGTNLSYVCVGDDAQIVCAYPHSAALQLDLSTCTWGAFEPDRQG